MPGGNPPAAPDAALARHEARRILAESRFRAASIPRPLHGVLHALGKAIEAPLHAIERLVADIGSHVPGGESTVWGVAAALVLLFCALIAVRRSRRALREPRAAGPAAAHTWLTAADLERMAAAAEREGRYADAVRLQFRAGLEQLAERELVMLVPSMPNAEIARAISSERFDVLARAFDEIVYGERPAGAEDVERARRDWADLLRSLSSGAHARRQPATARPA